MNEATTNAPALEQSSSIGVRALKNNLSRVLDRVRAGEEVVITDRGTPVARLAPLASDHSKLDALIAAGHARPPANTGPRPPLPALIETAGPVSDLLDEWRGRW